MFKGILEEIKKSPWESALYGVLVLATIVAILKV